MDSLKIAIIQWAPEHLNLESCIDKAEKAIEEASTNGARLVVFGESWFSGYPAWLDYCTNVAHWDHLPVKRVFRQMRDNALQIESPECKRLMEISRRKNVSLVLGANEWDPKVGKGTLFNSLFFINEKGQLVNVHRKLVPTYTEKLVHAPGDAYGLQSVKLSDHQVSGAICWEHWMPLTRQTLHDSGEEIHVAAWPKVHEMHQVASRQYAFEGRCYVLAVGQMYHSKDFPDGLEKPSEWGNKDRMILNGGSSVIGPDGKYIVEPTFDQETIIYAELDLKKVVEESMNLDVSGHYQRPDVFDFSVKRTRKK